MTLARELKYPLMLRPSYVLGGRAMDVMHGEEELLRYMAEAVAVSNESPVLLDEFLPRAVEFDVDAIYDGERVLIGGIMEHIEQAGVHSGDSACCLPPATAGEEVQEELARQTGLLAEALGVRGLMNVQFAIQDGDIYVLEVNPRASRSVPYVSKAVGIQLAKVAALVMVGRTLDRQGVGDPPQPAYFSVKQSVFPFSRFPGADPILGPEMKSTGEVMGVGTSFAEAYARAQEGAGVDLKRGGAALLSLRDPDKPDSVDLARMLQLKGFDLVATHGTASFLARHGVSCKRINKGARRPSAYRGPDLQWRGGPDREHHRGARLDPGVARNPRRSRSQQRHLFHHPGGRRRGLPGDRLLRRGRGVAAAGPARGNGDMTQVPMTRAGEQALREELKRLRNEDRPRLARAIGEAREHGDLRENAEYHAAKEQQGLVEARIRDIEGRLAHARVIDLDRIPHDGRVVFGVTVDLRSLDRDERVSYQIVGEDEARVREDAISFVSPMARSLIGKYEGDEISLSTPGGLRRYEILAVNYK